MPRPQPQRPPKDTEIKDAIVAQLRWDGRIDDSRLRVSVRRGRVTLSGTTQSYSARRAALLNAWSVLGVTDVVDGMKVRRTSRRGIDKDLQASVTGALVWNAEVDSSDLQVAVTNGSVTLTGSVDAYWKKIAAEELVSSLAGVTHIHNKLAVAPTQSIQDRAIAEAIVAALDRSASAEAGAVNVKVSKGVVTLAGKVSTHAGLQAATEAAARTTGVVDVTCHIKVVGERPG